MGDDVHATFQKFDASLSPGYLWLSRIYLYIYLLLGMCAILNIFIFIVEVNVFVS